MAVNSIKCSQYSQHYCIRSCFHNAAKPEMPNTDMQHICIFKMLTTRFHQLFLYVTLPCQEVTPIYEPDTTARTTHQSTAAAKDGPRNLGRDK